LTGERRTTAAGDAKSMLGVKTSANVAKSAGVQLLSLATTLIDRIVLTGILIREWGTDGFADWATVVSASGLVLTIELGFQQLVGNQLLRSYVKNRPNTFNHTLAWSLYTSLILSGLAVAAILAAALAIDLQSMLALRSEAFVPALVIMCVWSAVRVARGPLLQTYRGLAEFHNFIWADLGATLASTLLAALAVFLGANAVVVAAIYLLTTLVVSVAWSWRDLSRRFPFVVFALRRPPLTVTRQTLLAMRWYALFFVLQNVMQVAPILIIATLSMPATLLATFAVQRTLVNFIRTTSFGISNAAGAELSVLKLSGKGQSFERGLFALGRLNACLAAFAVVGLLVFGEHIVSIWTGRADLGSSTLLALLLIPAVAVAPAVGLQQTSVMLDRVKDQSLAYALYAAIGLVGAIALAPRFGIIGVAAAVAIGETVAIGLCAPLWAAREFNISYLRITARSFAVFAAVALWAGLAAWLVEALPIASRDLSRLVAPTLWAGLAFPPALWLCAPPGLRKAIVGRAADKWASLRS
jgi:O-antigen/teichoic acid export membrane protein